MADALSRIKEEWLSDEEADKLLEFVPMIPGDETVIKSFEEEECDQKLESPTPYTMSLAAMKAVFDNPTWELGEGLNWNTTLTHRFMMRWTLSK